MNICIIGAGGHGEVVLDTVRAAGEHKVSAFFDSNPLAKGKIIDGIEVVGTPDIANLPFLVAIGDVHARKEITEQLVAKGLEPVTTIHPTAYCASNAKVGPGSIVCAGAILCTHACVGQGGIINTSAVVEHHCQLGDFVHIAPGCVLTGRVTVEDEAFIGAGTTIIPCRNIGKSAVVGAGAVVTRDVPPAVTVAGVPARIMNSNA